MATPPQRSIIRLLLAVVSLVSALVLIAIGFVLLVNDAGRSANIRDLARPLGVLAGGGGLLALGMAMLIWEMSIRYNVRH